MEQEKQNQENTKCKFYLPNDKYAYLDGYLQQVMDSIVYNISKDWDFVGIITGDRMVRTGKSVITLNMGAYAAYRISQIMNTEYNFSHENIFFDSETMMDKAQKMPKHSVIIYDEAREGLAANKAMTRLQGDLLDFFNECGQLNHIFLLVLPDFFTMKEEIAVARSEFLVNVYRKSKSMQKDVFGDGKRNILKYLRGNFTVFNRIRKQNLYDLSKSTKKKNYYIVDANAYGSFTNNYPIDEDKYREMKADALARFKERHKRENYERIKSDTLRNAIVMENFTNGMKHVDSSRLLEKKYGYKIAPQTIGRIIKMLKEREAKKISDSDLED